MSIRKSPCIRRRRSGDQAFGIEIDAPDPKPAGLKGEPKALLAHLQLVVALGDLGFQIVAVALEPNQTLALQRHIELRGEEIGELAVVVEHRRDKQPVPEMGAVLLVV